MSYFASFTTSTLDVKSLPGMLSFHSAYITTGSFNPGTGQCNLFLAIEPTSSQVTYKLGLKGVDGESLLSVGRRGVGLQRIGDHPHCDGSKQQRAATSVFRSARLVCGGA
jgi:hypothetical protein